MNSLRLTMREREQPERERSQRKIKGGSEGKKEGRISEKGRKRIDS